jgi:hypothetical protein
MKLRFWQKEPEYDYLPERKLRQRETLSQVSERILIKQMKKDPQYGLAMAEKVKGIGKAEDKSLLSQLEELRELKHALSDFGGEGQGSLLKDIITALPEIVKVLPMVTQSQSMQQPMPQQIQQQEIRQIQQTKLLEPEPKVSIHDLGSLLDTEPEDAIQILESVAPQWLTILREHDYDSLLDKIKPFAETETEIAGIVKRLSGDDGKVWLNRLIKLSKQR